MAPAARQPAAHADRAVACAGRRDVVIVFDRSGQLQRPRAQAHRPHRHNHPITSPLRSCCGVLTLAAMAAAQQAFPLTQPAGNTTATESTAPLEMPLRMTQTKLVDRKHLVPGQALPMSFARWEMVASDPSGHFLFVPTETDAAAGLFRYDRLTGAAQVILQGNGGTRTANAQSWRAGNDEFTHLDPATWTPWGTLLTAEEDTGGGCPR